MRNDAFMACTHRPVIDMAATGRNIVRLRREAGLTVRDVQEVFGFSTPQAIYKWQHGEALPSLDNLLLLSRILRVSVEEILVERAAGEKMNAKE